MTLGAMITETPVSMFAVAVYNNFTCENKIYVVNTDNEVEAVKQALIADASAEYAEDTAKWIAEFPDDLDKVLEMCFNTDLVVAVRRL